MAQLPLALALADHASFATFVAGDSHAALGHVRAVAGGAGDTLWLWGAAGCGKSHLLQAACRAATEGGRRAMYVATRSARPEILAGLEHLDLLALDDVDAVAGEEAWETPLFGILNEFLSRRGGLLLAAATSPGAAGFALPDLKSRAAGAVAYRLKPLDDRDRALAVRMHAQARGLELEPVAADYLLRRVARDMRALTAWLDRLDRESLIEQRRLTIPFIRERLARE
ncbi:MAG TPA: DnaA regulatory inactivator Hda [Gammaproteobacteria bacterium]|nr:DnaA regulatory inactivator Hda [Gammaproteobacteria bacterium]